MLSEFYDLEWASLWRAQNEHFVPFFKFLLFSYTKLFGNAAKYWRELGVLVHIFAVGISYLLSLAISKNSTLSLCFCIFFAFCPLIWETMYMQSGLATTSSVFSWLLAILMLLKADESKKISTLLWGYIMLFIQSYTFGNNLFYPSVIIFLYLFRESPFRLPNLAVALMLQIVNLFVFLELGSFQNNQNFLGGTTFSLDLLERMATYFTVSFYANFGRALIGVEPSLSEGLVNYTILFPFLTVLLASIVAAYKSAKELRPFILTGWMNYGLVIGLISVSRYRLPYEQCLSSRYIYLIVPGLLLVIVPTLSFYFAKYRRFGVLMIVALLCRYTYTYHDLQRERLKAETLHARNYKLIVYAKDHPELEITDFLTTAYLPTERVTAMLNQYETERILSIDHRIPQNLRIPEREIKIRLKTR